MKFSLSLPRRLRTGAVVVAALATTGWAVRPLEQTAWATLREREPALRLTSLSGALGQGVTVGLLGGFRSIVADFFWLKANLDWMDSDLPATETGLKLTTAIDPRPLTFWLEGARKIAYDMPNWRIEEAAEAREKAGLTGPVPESAQRQINFEQADSAVRYLNEALAYHRNSPQVHLIYFDIAQILLRRRLDPDAALVYYRKAAELSDISYIYSRIYERKLHELGRLAEAYAWLVKLYPTLPKAPGTPGAEKMVYATPPSPHDIEAAEADVVLARIRELEKEQGIPAEKAFRP